MSEFSPLRDPVFLLTWQIHLSVVILFALLGIWAGMTRRPWYIAPTLFLALLWLFVPLEAPEPVVVLLLTVPVLAIACRIARWWLEKPKEEPSESSPSRLRFSLGDLLWLMVVVGMLTALLLQVFRATWERDLSWSAANLESVIAVDWPEVALSGVCLVLLAVATLIANRQPTRMRKCLSFLFVDLGVLAAAGLHHALVTQDWLLLLGWDAFVPDFGSYLRWSGRRAPSDLFIVYSLTFVQFTVLLWLGLQLITSNSVSAKSGSTHVLRSVAVVCFLVVMAGLGSLYVKMLVPSAWPSDVYPEINERPALMTALERLNVINSEGSSISDLYARDHEAWGEEATQLVADADQVLHHESITWFDSRHDAATLEGLSQHLHRNQLARNLGRVLGAQADSDWKFGERAASLDRTAACLRLARAMRQRRIAVDALVGKAIEDIAIEHLVAVRSELSCNEIHKLEAELQKLAATREPVELLLKRDEAFCDRALSWRARLTRILTRVVGIPLEEKEAIRFASQLSDAHIALIRTSLALRCYQLTHQEWPAGLDMLVPDELASLPIDPFSGQPLVYRKQEDAYVLYSVGRDGVDDGGRFGKYSDFHTESIDIDLEGWNRGYE